MRDALSYRPAEYSDLKKCNDQVDRYIYQMIQSRNDMILPESVVHKAFEYRASNYIDRLDHPKKLYEVNAWLDWLREEGIYGYHRPNTNGEGDYYFTFKQ